MNCNCAKSIFTPCQDMKCNQTARCWRKQLYTGLLRAGHISVEYHSLHSSRDKVTHLTTTQTHSAWLRPDRSHRRQIWPDLDPGTRSLCESLFISWKLPDRLARLAGLAEVLRLLTTRSRRSERARAGWQRARCLLSHTALITGDQQPKIQLV